MKYQIIMVTNGLGDVRFQIYRKKWYWPVWKLINVSDNFMDAEKIVQLKIESDNREAIILAQIVGEYP